MHVLVDLTEADLLARMRNFEDHFVERKVVKDDKDWKKTAVAFANSAPVGLPAILYIGVRDDGTIEVPQKNLDEAQKKFNAMMQKVFPQDAESLLQSARTLISVMQEMLPAEQRTAEDKKKPDEVNELMQEVWKWDVYKCGPDDLVPLADYLDHLAKRIVSA